MRLKRINHQAEKGLYITFVVLFFVLNLSLQYFLLYPPFNRYSLLFIMPVTFHLTDILGNLLILLLIYGIAKILTKKRLSFMIYLLINTILLGGIAWALSVYYKYYHQLPDLYDFSILNNDAGNLSIVLFYTAILELFTHGEILFLIPMITLIVIFSIYVVKFKNMKPKYHRRKGRYVLLIVVSLIGGYFMNHTSKKVINEKWPLHHQKDLFRAQTIGVYSHFFHQFIEIDIGINKDKKVDIDINDYTLYDKNTSNYTNIFNETYSANTLPVGKASTVNLDSSIYQEDLFGIFEDKNVIFFQLESFNKFVLDNPLLNERNVFKNLNKLIDESYYFENFYSNVGMGHTSDAELAVLTGLMPDGKSNVFWDYDKYQYSLNTIPKILNSNYHTETFHGDHRYFYNRNIVYDEMIYFDKYYSFEENDPYEEGTTNGRWVFPDYISKPTPNSPWLSEYDLLQWVRIRGQEHIENDEKFFFFPITVHPHTPYFYDPYEDDPMFTKDDFPVDGTTLKMLNYQRYYDEFFADFFEMAKELTNTVYVFHGDHGTLVSNKDTKTLMAKENPTDLEVWQETNKTTAFIYAPDDNDDNIPAKGLITGRQPKVRSQIDLYRTVLELMGQITPDDIYFGVNALSDETTFVLKAKNSILVTDDFYMNLKNYIFSKDLSDKTVYFINDTSVADLDKISQYALQQKAFNDALMLKNKFNDLYKLKRQNLN